MFVDWIEIAVDETRRGVGAGQIASDAGAVRDSWNRGRIVRHVAGWGLDEHAVGAVGSGGQTGKTLQ